MKRTKQSAGRDDWHLINREQLIDMTMGDLEFLVEMIELFLRSIPEQMNNLKQAIEENDSQKLSHTAHACKGLIGNYTTKAPYRILRSLETDAKTDQLDDSFLKYDSLESEISQLIIELRMLMSEEYNKFQSSTEKTNST